jgi:hypothetical protein
MMSHLESSSNQSILYNDPFSDNDFFQPALSKRKKLMKIPFGSNLSISKLFITQHTYMNPWSFSTQASTNIILYNQLCQGV